MFCKAVAPSVEEREAKEEDGKEKLDRIKAQHRQRIIFFTIFLSILIYFDFTLFF